LIVGGYGESSRECGQMAGGSLEALVDMKGKR